MKKDTSTLLGALLGSLLLTACAQAPVSQPISQPAHQTDPAQIASPANTPVNPHQQPDSRQEPPLVLPNIELTGELLYDFLLTEIASQRGHTALAVKGSAELARKSRDPRIARRAAQLAVEAGRYSRRPHRVRARRIARIDFKT